MSKFDIGSILGKVTKDGIEGLGNSIDGLVTSKEEKMTLKKEVFQIFNNTMLRIEEMSNAVLLAEANGNELQRNWRPIMALTFGFIVVSTYFFFPVINIFAESEDLSNLIKELKSNDNFWTLLQVMIGGYTVGRSAEKISEKVTEVMAENKRLKNREEKEKN